MVRVSAIESLFSVSHETVSMRGLSERRLLTALLASALAATAQTYTTKATTYDPTTGGASCDGIAYKATDHVVALDTALFDARANKGWCGTAIELKAGSTTLLAKIVDRCGGCNPNGVGTSRTARPVPS